MTKPRRDRLGDHLTALSGGALAFSLLLVFGLLALLAYHGLSHFWQQPLELVALKDGRHLLGVLQDREPIPPPSQAAPSPGWRILLKTANRDVNGIDFTWVDESAIAGTTQPADVVAIERREWGEFYGRLVQLKSGTNVVADGAGAVRSAFPEVHARAEAALDAIHALEKGPIGDINHDIRALELRHRDTTARREEYGRLAERLAHMREDLGRDVLVVEAVDGTRKELPVANVVRLVEPNAMGFGARAALYASRLGEFGGGEPRESNTEGGIFPAIFGTVMMVFLMSFAVTPLGVLAAVYLREYARQGALVRAVRIAVNNLAGVPSIVFGMFGLGFFVYLVGGSIDRLFFPEALPAPTFGTGGILWAALTLALLTVPVVIVAAEEGLAAVPRAVREGSLALGATKFETTWRIVVPAAAPGILTGMILAMARAAGEVAPLMIVGMVKLAPQLPIDHHFPFVHLERKFMHLGFHIYDLGFQSPNVEASKPLVFATALLLVVVVTLLNLAAIGLRNHLRNKYSTSAV